MVPGKAPRFPSRSSATIGVTRVVNFGAIDRTTFRVSHAKTATYDMGVFTVLEDVIRDESLDIGNKALPLRLVLD